MVHPLNQNFLAKLENTRCEQLLTFIKVYWGDGAITYSEQELLMDSFNYIYSYPALLSLGELTTALKLNNNGTALNFSVTLDDADGHLRERFNREILNGTRVDCYINFAGLDITEALLVGVGTINSDTISWVEKERFLNFGVEGVLTSKNVSFKAYPDMVAGQELDFHEKYFPFVFGSAKQVPAIELERGKKAMVTHSRNFGGVVDPAWSGADTLLYILEDMTGYQLDTDIDTVFRKLDFTGAGLDSNSGTGGGKVLEFDGRRHIFVLNNIVNETVGDINLLPFDMTDIKGPDVDVVGSTFTDHYFIYWWVDVNPAVTDLTGQFLDFNDFNGRPSLFASKVEEHIDTGGGVYRIKLSHQPRWGALDQRRSPILGNSPKEWFSDFTIDESDGSFSSSISVRARASYVMHEWGVNFIDYTAVNRDGTTDTEPTVKEYIPQVPASTQASLFMTSDVDSTNPNLKHWTTFFIPENKNTTLNSFITFTWGLKDETGYDLDEDDFKSQSDGVTTEALMIPDAINRSAFISNIFQSGEAIGNPQDIKVRANSNLTNNIIPIQSTALTTVHDDIIPSEELKSTIVEINPPLEYERYNSFYSGEVFVDHTPAYTVHNGAGGTMDLDTENAVDVIAWLMGVYTDLIIFKDQENFLDVREKVSVQKMAFYVAREVDAVSLANIIAWEHKLALVFFGNSVKIIDLNKEPKIEHAFTVSNVTLQTVKLGFVPSNDVITDFRFRFKEKKNDGAGEVLIFNNNISRYGKNTQFIDVLTLDNQDDVFDLAKFWGNRLSRAWRTIEFEASIEALKLQPYDAVTFDIPVLSTNTITGFINTITYEPNSFTVKVTATLASEASDTLTDSQAVTDSSYWLGLEDLKLQGDKRVGIVSDLDGAKVQKFSLTDLNTLKPFERRL